MSRSSNGGYLALNTLIALERRWPQRLNLLFLATDDPLNPHARISVKKRIWRYIDEAHRLRVESACVDTALSAGVPVYTGAVKDEQFRKKLHGVHPDAIVVCGFGQILDRAIIELPRFGVYNLHPSDLAAGHGAGPAPHDDLAARGDANTRWSIHLMTEAIDAGPVLARSPAIRVTDAMNRLPRNPLVIYDKLTAAIPWLMRALVEQLMMHRLKGGDSSLAPFDAEAIVPPEQRRGLLEPVMTGTPCEQLPTLPEGMFAG